MKVCVYCGSRNKDRDKKCIMCGRDMHTGEQNSKDNGFVDFNLSKEVEPSKIETAELEVVRANDPLFKLKPLFSIDCTGAAERAKVCHVKNLDDLCHQFVDFSKKQGFEPTLDSARALIAAVAATKVICVRAAGNADVIKYASRIMSFFSSMDTIYEVEDNWTSVDSFLFSQKDGAESASDVLCDIYSANYMKDYFCTLTFTHAQRGLADAYLSSFLSYSRNKKREFPMWICAEQFNSLPKYVTYVSEIKRINRREGLCVNMPSNIWCLTIDDADGGYYTPVDAYETGSAITLSLSGRSCEVVKNDGEEESGGISLPDFLRVIHDIPEDYFLSEEQWKKFDSVESFLADRIGVRFDNRVWRCLETFSSVYLALGGEINEALDYMLEAMVLPRISSLDVSKLSAVDGKIGICEVMSNVFGADNIPHSMQSLYALGYK